MFYYLFDDWVTTYALVTQRNHPYRKELERLRKQVFEKPNVDLIESLHLTGRRLTVLKLMYQSYELIAKRVLQRDRMTRDQARQLHSHQQSRFSNSHDNSTVLDELSVPEISDDILAETTPTRVRLSISAVVRFERLIDRIQLYALNEIDECLHEKESLVFMVSSSSIIIRV